MDILLIGGGGQLGRSLWTQPWPEGARLVSPSRQELDLHDAAAIDGWVASRDWAAVINTAAYTAVDDAESQVAEAWAINALAPAVLAAAAARFGIPIVQISTDYVFSGSKGEPYREEDPVDPINVYGASKAGGEQAVRTANPRHAILRTAWLVSPHRRNFVKTMLRLAAEQPLLKIVDDQTGSPTLAADLAAMVAVVTLRLIADEGTSGTYHCVNRGAATWFGFAQAIFARAAERGFPAPRLEAIATSVYPRRARRPADSRLASRRLETTFGIVPRPWEAALAELIDSLVP